MLTKCETVMQFNHTYERTTYFYHKDREYKTLEDVPDIIRSFTMAEEQWNDMGSPLTITVTVEPGDRLNA